MAGESYGFVKNVFVLPTVAPSRTSRDGILAITKGRECRPSS